MNEGLMSFLPFIIIFVLFYFMLIRPQMKQAKEHRSMLDSLKKGDEVVLSSGIIAKINNLSDFNWSIGTYVKNLVFEFYFISKY